MVIIGNLANINIRANIEGYDPLLDKVLEPCLCAFCCNAEHKTAVLPRFFPTILLLNRVSYDFSDV